MTKGTHYAKLSHDVKSFRWSHQKNELLKARRGISFEEIVLAIEADGLLDVVEHTNPNKYPHQRVLIVKVENYAYLVPFVEQEGFYFLKTVIPSRKATRSYLRGDLA